MTERPAPSVRRLLADLHAYRLKTMAPADLRANIDQRELLKRTADRSAFVKAGDVVEPFSLPEVHGGTVALDRRGRRPGPGGCLRRRGPRLAGADRGGARSSTPYVSWSPCRREPRIVPPDKRR